MAKPEVEKSFCFFIALSRKDPSAPLCSAQDDKAGGTLVSPLFGGILRQGFAFITKGVLHYVQNDNDDTALRARAQ